MAHCFLQTVETKHLRLVFSCVEHRNFIKGHREKHAQEKKLKHESQIFPFLSHYCKPFSALETDTDRYKSTPPGW